MLKNKKPTQKQIYQAKLLMVCESLERHGKASGWDLLSEVVHMGSGLNLREVYKKLGGM